ncbi:MAG: hypothetical protein ACOH2H_12220 [Cypionkella sp.]
MSRSFQIPHPFKGMSVYENILVGATFGRPSPHGAEARAAEVLQLTGLARRTNDRAGSLTLLERKRLEMARALGAANQFLCLAEGRVSLAGKPGDHSRDAISAAHFGT